MMNRFTISSTSLRRGAGRAIMLCGLTAMLALAGAGCSDDNPSQNTTSYEAKGLVLRLGTADSVVDSSGVRGTLQVAAGATTGDISVLFIGKENSLRSVPQSGHTLAWSVADSTVATVESVSAWSFRVRGHKAGTTTATLKLMKGATTVYTSAPITITVTGTSVEAAFQVGDTMTYNFYDRDTTSGSPRIESSKSKRMWVVLDNNLTFQGRTNVTRILNITYSASGSEFSRDTIYIQKDNDGSIWQYDYLYQMVLRVETGEALGNSLPREWAKISSTSTTALSWNGLMQDSLLIEDVPLVGGLSSNAALRFSGTHRGSQPLTVGGNSYADALHTDQTLKFKFVLPALGNLQVINDSLAASVDFSPSYGIVRESFDSRILTASLAGQMMSLPVRGYEMELVSYVRAD